MIDFKKAVSFFRMLCRENCSDTWLYAFFPRSGKRVFLCRRYSSALAMLSDDWGGTRIPFFLCSMRGLFSGILVVMMGSLAAMASMMALLIPSPSVGSTKMSVILRISFTSVRFPRKWICFFERKSSVCFMSSCLRSPSPTMSRERLLCI